MQFGKWVLRCVVTFRWSSAAPNSDLNTSVKLPVLSCCACSFSKELRIWRSLDAASLCLDRSLFFLVPLFIAVCLQASSLSQGEPELRLHKSGNLGTT